jgi:hypothetical protein
MTDTLRGKSATFNINPAALEAVILNKAMSLAPTSPHGTVNARNGSAVATTTSSPIF